MFRIFIVEDDRKLVSLLVENLQKYGYEAKPCLNFEIVYQEFMTFDPHIILLDVNLPSFDGYYWCRKIRTQSMCPILFISARDGKMDQVMALENGADDYITKPFDYDIVRAKIKSQLRRAYGSYASSHNDRIVNIEGLILDVERLNLVLGSNKITLSLTETKILDELMKKDGRVVGRERLLEKIWDDEIFVDENTLNVYITRVRKKLAVLGITGALQTIRGKGYQLVPNWGVSS
jgi:DNA-binding response OmpR family regulator